MASNMEDGQALDGFYKKNPWAKGLTMENLEMAIVNDLDIGRSNRTVSDVLALALHGVDIHGNRSELCGVAVQVNTEPEFIPAIIKQTTTEVQLFSIQQTKDFRDYLRKLGLGSEISRINSVPVQDNQLSDSTSENIKFYHNSFHTTVPTCRCVLKKDCLKLSRSVIDDLKRLQRLILNYRDDALIQSTCEGIFRKYGSHVYVGDIHFGGIYSWEAWYSGVEGNAHAVRQSVDGVLADKLLSPSAPSVSTIEVSFHMHKTGGPRSAPSFDLWKVGLESDSDSWTVIDRGRDCVGIWEILQNHQGEIDDVTNLVQILQNAWQHRQDGVVVHSTQTGDDIRNPSGTEETSPQPTQDMAIITNDEQPIPGAQANAERVDLLKNMELEEFYPEKITLADVMKVAELQQGKLPWNILEKLIMLDSKALCTEVRKSKTENKTTPLSLESIEDFTSIADLFDNDDHLHPSDVFSAIFACCDLNLKQTVVQKMHQCRLAIPFLFPSIHENTLTYCLWALRTSILVWRDSSERAIETSAVKYPLKIVSCLRFGRPNFSKSKILNNVISEQDTFVNLDSPNGNRKRVLAEGLVEGSFFLPSRRASEKLLQPTAFLNLRGDGTQHKKQVDILSRLSNVVMVSVDISDLNNGDIVSELRCIHQHSKKIVMIFSNRQRLPKEQALQCLKDYRTKVGSASVGNIERILTFTGETEKNAAQITSEARDKLSRCLEGEEGRSLQDASVMMTNHGIKLDEMNQHCQEGKNLADLVIQNKSKDGTKANLLPLQGQCWQEWCKLLKAKKRSKQTSDEEGGIQEVGREEQMMKNHRQVQERLLGEISPFVQSFIDGLTQSLKSSSVDFYMQWLKIYLEDISREELPSLQHCYKEKLDLLKAVKNRQRESIREHEDELRRIEQQLDDTSLGLEHLMREVGQIYEASIESNNDKHHKLFSELPALAANLILRGYSLEIMDGDAAGVPLVWINAVFIELEKILGKQNLFCLSVLGIQSSGKSTLLNTMFGLQLRVAAGRCTRGVYMQLLEVKPRSEFPFSYVVVMDSEGLRAQETSGSNYEHDNELATFVIGLGNVTLINVKGENVAEIKDILQIASHAFLRMMMVNKSIQKDRSCVFVHQNVPAVDAKEKMQTGTQKFEEALDQMTRQAAKLENIADVDSFNDIIQFDNRKHIWYFPDLWHGDPPMASVNTGYHDKVKELKSSLLNDLAKESKCLFGLPDLRDFIKAMWHGVLADDFVFSFRNSIVTKAYKDLEERHSQLKWELELWVKEWLNKIQWGNDSTKESLQRHNEEQKKELAELSRSKAKEVVSKLKAFIDTNSQSQVMRSWQKEKEIALEYKGKSILQKAVRDIDEMTAQEAFNILHDSEQNIQKQEILRKAKELAEELKDKDEQILAHEFDKMWNKWMNEIIHHQKRNDNSITDRMEKLLIDEFQYEYQMVSKEIHDKPLDTRTYKGSLSESFSIADIEEGHICDKRKRKLKVLTFSEEPVNIKQLALPEITRIFQEVDSYLQNLSMTTYGFQSYDAQAVFKIVRTSVAKLNSSKDAPFSIPTDFEIKLVADAASFALGKFKKMQEYYDQNHSVTAKLKAYRQTTWNMFMNVVRQESEEIILVDMICDEVEQLIDRATKKHLQLAVEKEITPHFMTKAKLIKAVLRSLAEEENFKEYQKYISCSRTFTMDWLLKYVGKYIFEKRFGSVWYLDKAQEHIQETISGIQEGILKATRESEREQSTSLWLISFTYEVSSLIDVTGMSMSRMTDYQVRDFKDLGEKFAHRLQTVQENLQRNFSQHSMENVKWKNSAPHEEILNTLWGCEALCPFCREPCVKSDLNHGSQSDCHKSIQHRPQGVTSRYWKESRKLLVENCSYGVQSTAAFRCLGIEHTCEVTEQNFKVYHPYKDYKKHFPDWEIPPSPDMDSSHYWMWYLNKFQKEIAETAYLELADMPVSWKNITKGSAIESLSLYD